MTGVMLTVKKSEIVIVCILSLVGLALMTYIPISNVIFTVIFTTHTPRDFKYDVQQCRVRGRLGPGGIEVGGLCWRDLGLLETGSR